MLFSVFKEINKPGKLMDGVYIVFINVVKPYIGDQYKLLSDIVEGYDLVKKHQVNVLEIFSIRGFWLYGRLAVLYVVVGKVSDQSSCKCRKIFKPRAPVMRQNVTDNA